MTGSDFPDPGKSLFDVLIVGAGINGCSTARELSNCGYSVVLVDNRDLGGVTTARSGRVLHCGLQLLAPKRSIIDYLADPLELLMRLRSARRAVQDFEEFCREQPGQIEAFEETPLYAKLTGYVEKMYVDIGDLTLDLAKRLDGSPELSALKTFPIASNISWFTRATA